MAASKEVTINTISSTSVAGLVIGQVWRSLLGAFTGVHTRIPGRVGAWYTGQKRGLRELRMSCFVIGETFQDRRDAVTATADWLDWDDEVVITVSDMPGKYYLGVLSDPPDPDEWREAGTFDLVFLIQPYAFDETISTESWTSDADDNHTFNPNLKSPWYPIIHIKPTNGTLTGFTLESNGDTLYVTGLAIASGTFVTVNSIVPVVVGGIGTDVGLTGAFNPIDAILNGVEGSFPVLMPDMTNNIHFVKTGGTATSFDISVEYRRTYRD